MRIKKWILVFICLFIISINKVYALGIGLSGNTNISQGETFTVSLDVKDAVDLTALDTDLNYDNSKLELVSYEGQNGFNVSVSSRIAGYGASKNGNFSMLVLKFKAKNEFLPGESTVISTGSVVASDSEANELNASAVSMTIKVDIPKSNDNYLKRITVNGKDVENFSKDTLTYNLDTPMENITIDSSVNDSKASVSGNGTRSLKYGKNTFLLTVTSESGQKRVYTLNITRVDNRSKNNYLSSLSVSNTNITFNKTKTTYDVKVKSDISEVTIKATLEDNKASFVSGSDPRKVKLKYGKNTFLIKVKSEIGEEKTYTINIEREDNRSNNTEIKDIKLSSGSIKIEKNKEEYEVKVKKEVSEIDIEVIPQDKNAKVEYDKKVKLNLGENTVKIKVTAENEEKEEYKLVIIRSEEEEKLDNNSYLRKLIIDNYQIPFSKNIFSYDLKINKEKYLNISTETDDVKATVEVFGNENLENGSVIEIKVTAEDMTSRIYQINIIKEKKNILPIILIPLIGIILLVVVFLVFKNKNNVKKGDITIDDNNSQSDDVIPINTTLGNAVNYSSVNSNNTVNSTTVGSSNNIVNDIPIKMPTNGSASVNNMNASNTVNSNVNTSSSFFPSNNG